MGRFRILKIENPQKNQQQRKITEQEKEENSGSPDNLEVNQKNWGQIWNKLIGSDGKPIKENFEEKKLTIQKSMTKFLLRQHFLTTQRYAIFDNGTSQQTTSEKSAEQIQIQPIIEQAFQYSKKSTSQIMLIFDYTFEDKWEKMVCQQEKWPFEVVPITYQNGQNYQKARSQNPFYITVKCSCEQQSVWDMYQMDVKKEFVFPVMHLQKEYAIIDTYAMYKSHSQRSFKLFQMMNQMKNQKNRRFMEEQSEQPKEEEQEQHYEPSDFNNYRIVTSHTQNQNEQQNLNSGTQNKLFNMENFQKIFDFLDCDLGQNRDDEKQRLKLEKKIATSYRDMLSKSQSQYTMLPRNEKQSSQICQDVQVQMVDSVSIQLESIIKKLIQFIGQQSHFIIVLSTHFKEAWQRNLSNKTSTQNQDTQLTSQIQHKEQNLKKEKGVAINVEFCPQEIWQRNKIDLEFMKPLFEQDEKFMIFGFKDFVKSQVDLCYKMQNVFNDIEDKNLGRLQEGSSSQHQEQITQNSRNQGQHEILSKIDESLKKQELNSHQESQIIKYEGPYVDGKNEGKGIEYYSDGTRYEGQFKNDVKEGKGIQYDLNGQKKYEGDWKNGKYEGMGTKFLLGDRIKIDGQWKEGQQHGKITIYIKQQKKLNKNQQQDEQQNIHKQKFRGIFQNGKRNGWGILYYDNGNRYQGNWRQNTFDGKGIFYYIDGRWYDGDWKSNKKSGQGTFYNLNGNRYEGEFLNDKIHGKGTYQYSNGDKYQGEWKQNKRQGKGTYFYVSGAKYDGDWINDKPEGYGVHHYVNGNRYEGQYKDGKAQGKGTYFFANGDKYEGDFKNGIKEGQGVLYFANGSRYEGEWKNDKQEGHGTYYFANGNKIEGQWKAGKKI